MKLLGQMYYVFNDYSKNDVHTCTTILALREPHAMLFLHYGIMAFL